MASFLGALGTYMASVTAISDIVDNKIYSFPEPQDVTHPYIVMFRVGNETENTIADPLDFENDTFQVDVYSDSYTEANNLEEAIVTALNMLNQTTIGGYHVFSIMKNYAQDLSILENDNSQNKIVRKQLDFIIHRERLITT